MLSTLLLEIDDSIFFIPMLLIVFVSEQPQKQCLFIKDFTGTIFNEGV